MEQNQIRSQDESATLEKKVGVFDEKEWTILENNDGSNNKERHFRQLLSTDPVKARVLFDRPEIASLSKDIENVKLADPMAPIFDIIPLENLPNVVDMFPNSNSHVEVEKDKEPSSAETDAEVITQKMEKCNISNRTNSKDFAKACLRII